jgi:hypothetical protein
MAPLPHLDDRCGKYLTYRHFIECSDTFKTNELDNTPKAPGTYVALTDLATNILDPVIETFGDLTLTYGISCPSLSRDIKRNISPKLDQHASHELNTRGNLVCERLGASVDFKVGNTNSLRLAQWIVENCSFDRLYIYGEDRPIHVSYSPDQHRSIVLMRPSSLPNRKIPQTIKEKNFLEISSVAN